MSSIKFLFVVPDPESFQSGGNLYNKYLIEALKDLSFSVQIIDFEVFVSLGEFGEDTFIFIDTLYFNEFERVPFELKNCYLIVHHLESLELESQKNIPFFEEFEKPTLERFDGFLVSSNFTKNYLIENGLREKQFLVVEPALCFQPQPKFALDSKIKVLLVANLIKRKGILPFFKEIQKRKMASGSIQIQIIGSLDFEPEYANVCLKLVADSSLSKMVQLCGSKDHHYIRKALSEANLFISTSSMETFGMALQEAVAFRLPILAIEKGNASFHVEEGKNGFLFSTIDALVDKLEILSLNESKFKELIHFAWSYRKHESYNWAQAAKLFLKQLKRNVG